MRPPIISLSWEQVLNVHVPEAGLGPGNGSDEVLRSYPLGVFSCLFLHPLAHTKCPPLSPTYPHTHTAPCSAGCLEFSLYPSLSLLFDHSMVQELTL